MTITLLQTGSDRRQVAAEIAGLRRHVALLSGDDPLSREAEQLVANIASDLRTRRTAHSVLSEAVAFLQQLAQHSPTRTPLSNYLIDWAVNHHPNLPPRIRARHSITVPLPARTPPAVPAIPAPPFAERRRLGAAVARVHDLITWLGTNDPLTRNIRTWAARLRDRYQAREDEERVLREAIQELEEILVDPLFPAEPLADPLLGNDGWTYSRETLQIHRAIRMPPERRHLSPKNQNSQVPFFAEPHLLARALIVWIRRHNPDFVPLERFQAVLDNLAFREQLQPIPDRDTALIEQMRKEIAQARQGRIERAQREVPVRVEAAVENIRQAAVARARQMWEQMQAARANLRDRAAREVPERLEAVAERVRRADLEMRARMGPAAARAAELMRDVENVAEQAAQQAARAAQLQRAADIIRDFARLSAEQQRAQQVEAEERIGRMNPQQVGQLRAQIQGFAENLREQIAADNAAVREQVEQGHAAVEQGLRADEALAREAQQLLAELPVLAARLAELERTNDAFQHNIERLEKAIEEKKRAREAGGGFFAELGMAVLAVAVAYLTQTYGTLTIPL